MISVRLFREYVALVDKKIEELAGRFVEFRPVAQELRQKAIEIENCSHQELDREDEAAPPIALSIEEPQQPASPGSSTSTSSQQPRVQTVQRRRARVRRKIIHYEVGRTCYCI